MSTKLNIALLCNNKMALPALECLVQEGVLCAVATTGKDPEVAHIFREKAAVHSISYSKINYRNYEAQLEEWLANAQPDVVFVMTFPWRIPVSILSIPQFGFLNFHYGLLPQMRGADPIFESIRQRKPYAGATVHIMDAQFDTGAIIMQEQVPLPAEFTYGMLSSQLAYVGGKMCQQLIHDLTGNKLATAQQQDESIAQYWPRITESELYIRWKEMNSAEIIALVRSCNPIAKGIPAMVNGWKIGICDVSEVNVQGDASSIAPGSVIAIDNQNGLLVYCRDGKALKLDVVYTAEGFFPGYKLAFFGVTPGSQFTHEIANLQQVSN